MANDARSIANLNVVTTLSSTDRVVVLTNPNTTANVQTITTSNFAASIPAQFLTQYTPANSTSNGIVGQITYDSNYIYVCTANNVWTRTPLGFF